MSSTHKALITCISVYYYIFGAFVMVMAQMRWVESVFGLTLLVFAGHARIQEETEATQDPHVGRDSENSHGG